MPFFLRRQRGENEKYLIEEKADVEKVTSMFGIIGYIIIYEPKLGKNS